MGFIWKFLSTIIKVGLHWYRKVWNIPGCISLLCYQSRKNGAKWSTFIFHGLFTAIEHCMDFLIKDMTRYNSIAASLLLFFHSTMLLKIPPSMEMKSVDILLQYFDAKQFEQSLLAINNPMYIDNSMWIMIHSKKF